VFLALFAWQVAPVAVVPDSTGRVRLSVATGTGEWENASFDCEGRVTDAISVPSRSTGGRLDLHLDDGLSHITVVGGRTWTDDPLMAQGAYFGGLYAAEVQKAGVALGVIRRGRASGDTEIRPTFLLRLGDVDRAHLRFDIYPASETPTLSGDLRVGVGFGQGRRRKLSGFVGLGRGPYQEKAEQSVLTADLGVPVGGFLDVLLRGYLGGRSTDARQWGAGAGLRLNLGH